MTRDPMEGSFTQRALDTIPSLLLEMKLCLLLLVLAGYRVS